MTSPLAKLFLLTSWLSLGIPGCASAETPPTPRWAPRVEDRTNKSLMASYLEGDWTTELGKLTIKRTGEGDVDHFIGHIYRPATTDAAYVLEDLVPSLDASGLTGTWRAAGASEKRALRIVLNLADGDKFIAGGDGYIGGLMELSGTRGYTAPATPAPQTPVPQSPAPQRPTPQNPPPQTPSTPQPSTPQSDPSADGFEPLATWDVRIDKVENPREDRLTHVYVTLRNASTQTQLQTGDIWLYLEDTSGVMQRSGQGLRAIPGPPQLFGSPPPIVMPGKTITAKYIFDRVRGHSVTKITVVDGDQQAEFDF